MYCRVGVSLLIQCHMGEVLRELKVTHEQVLCINTEGLNQPSPNHHHRWSMMIMIICKVHGPNSTTRSSPFTKPMTLASSERMKGLGAQSSIGALCGLSMGILSLHPNFLDFAYHFYSKVPKCVCWLSIGFALRPESFVCEGKLRNLPLTSISTSPNKRSPKTNQVNQNIISLNKGLLHTNKLQGNDLYTVKLQILFSLRWWVPVSQ